MPDITQHRTGEGWLYGAFIIDAWSRRVLGWALADHCRAWAARQELTQAMFEYVEAFSIPIRRHSSLEML